MFVSHEHGIELGNIFADRGQTPGQLPAADSGIEQQARPPVATNTELPMLLLARMQILTIFPHNAN